MLKKIFKSAIANSWFSAIVRLISSLIAIPIVITKLSIEEINVWFLFSSVIALSQGVQFGFNTTFARFITYVNSGIKIDEFKKLRFKKDNKYENKINKLEFSKVFYLMKYVYIFLAIMYFMVLVIIGYFSLSSPIESLQVQSDGWIAGSIIAVSTTLSLAFGYYYNFMIGINKVVLAQRINAISNLIGLFIILLVLFLYPTLISIVLVYQIVLLSTLIATIYFSKKELLKLKLEKVSNPFDPELFKIVWDSAWKSGITTIIANIVKHISSILVAQFFTPSVSASFLFTKRIFDIIESFTMTTYQARIPMIARYRSQGNFNILIPYLRQTQYISYGVYIVGYLSLIVAGEFILSFIGSNVDIGSYSLIILFSLATFSSRWAGMTAMVSASSNHIVDYINLPVVSIIYLSVIYLFHESIGINVFPFAMMLGFLLASPTLIFSVYKTIHTTFWQYEKRVFVPLFCFLFIINFIYYWSQNV